MELSLLPLFAVGRVQPDFFLIFLAFYAFRVSWKRIVTLSFFVGLLRDLVTNSFFGLETASCVGGAILLRFLALEFDREKRSVQLVSLFAFSWVTLLLFVLFSFLVGERYLFEEGIFVNMFLTVIYTSGFGWLLFPLLEKWLKPALQMRQYELF
ncbi:MAG: rod shape-determining protein MreD [Candidatus Omnitrophica bacterium]|nr:rod shape-determining protein MreD [Candidatus Omnitrophota bacterium]